MAGKKNPAVTTHEDFLNMFSDDRKPLLEALLAAVNEACPELTEIIKWNAPSFCDRDRDRLTIMLHKKDQVGLILHTGARPKEDRKAPPIFQDETGMLEWNSNIRATIPFRDLAGFQANRDRFKEAVKRWIEETKNL